MSNYLIFFLFSISIPLTYFSLRNLIPVLRKILIDNPNSRSSHKVPIARGGGAVFVTYGITFSLLLGSIIQLICLPLALIGLIDDKYNISSLLRFFIQFLTVLFLCNLSTLYSTFEDGIFYKLVFILIFVSGISIINFINFMDGIDGIVSGCMIIIFSTIAYDLMPSIWPLVGALIGFILLNWYPAKIFMGDVGSTFLGAVYFGAISQSRSWEQFLGFVLLSTPLIADAFTCVLRRFFSGKPIFKAHSSHLYQRLFSQD